MVVCRCVLKLRCDAVIILWVRAFHGLCRRVIDCELMAELLRLFVSATQDLDAERAAIGRALADLPLQIGMEIRRTPAAGAALETMHELIANVDRFYFLVGQDITAPAGAEWLLAWKLERPVLPLRRRQGAAQPARDPGGAEGGGVLLDMGHREPLLGVALDE